MRINTNVNAMMAHRNMTAVNDGLSKSLERLSSGLRITSAKDDAAGIAVSETMNTQIRALAIADRNIQDAISFLNARDQAIASLTDMAQRMREIAVSANNTFNSPATLDAMQTEFAQLAAEGTRLLETAEFNGKKLFGYTGDTPTDVPLTQQVGATTADTVTFTLITPNWSTVYAGGTPVLDVTTGASAAITALDTLLDTAHDETASATGLISERAYTGASINRLESTLANLQVYRENLQASFSRIRDTDVAAEMTTMTRNQIILQTSTAMLAQANAQPQSVLALFK